MQKAQATAGGGCQYAGSAVQFSNPINRTYFSSAEPLLFLIGPELVFPI